MKKTIVPFLTVAISLSSLSASRADTYVLKITKMEFVAGQPNTTYETNPGQTADVTISSKCSYQCQNTSGRSRDTYMTWIPQVSISTQPYTMQLGTSFVVRHNMIMKLPHLGFWRRTDDILTFTVTAPIDLYKATSTTYLTEDKTGEDITPAQIDTIVTVRPYA